MAVSFGRKLLAFGTGLGQSIAENEKEARAEKKKDERAYLDRYTQAAQNAMRFAETDRRERNVKVEGHRKNLGLITAAIKQTGASDIEARQIAAQIYSQNRTAEGAQIAANKIDSAIESVGPDAAARRGVFDGLNGVIDPNNDFTLDQLAQQYSGPRTTMESYMPDLGTFDNRTALQKLLGREVKEPESIAQTRKMFAGLSRKDEPISEITIPESDIRLPSPIELDTAKTSAAKAFKRYEYHKGQGNHLLADKEYKIYQDSMARIKEEEQFTKDGKALMTTEQYIKMITASGTRRVFISGDKARSKIVRDSDVDKLGTDESVYRAWKFLSVQDQKDPSTIKARDNFNTAAQQFGFDKNTIAKMEVFDKQRLGAPSLDDYVARVKNAKVLADMGETDSRKMDEYLSLPEDLRGAVGMIYGKSVNGKGVTEAQRVGFYEDLRKAFFFPQLVGSQKDTLYSMEIKKLFD